MYFQMGSKYKNIYEQRDQVFHCYGRRTNRFLLVNYGFCLRNNKYDSLSFRVWVDFDWHNKQHTDSLTERTVEEESKEFWLGGGKDGLET